ncbi:helix-hairpin-helix domain-containing protein [Microvirga sp. STR05]|uniref:Helix-hairpin-helix domain-containing protein n=1 Tax=Hymenobacter duratus TaxID=2771356 RepID=A0ABR8JCT8_9BACT|nr:helix-hairpin-helix domain-containing protein [Hymenobacter duratus]MBD2714622.1 helix-hairpin-helix domain-containing protein [Hymenobacter duratus]MBR7949526.1 helix-hairpin-helix domain-containing protein [Microvirga sp. STR05]
MPTPIRPARATAKPAGLWASFRATRRRFFGFSRRETSGFVVLLALLVLLLFAPQLLRPHLPAYNPAPDRQQLDAWATELAARRQPRPTYTRNSRYPKRTYAARATVAQVPLAPFDPNRFSATDWQARGLPAWLGERLVKYREAVGGFRAKEQLRRAYGLSDTTYARLAPYIQLPEQLPAREPRTYGSRAADGSTGRFATRPFEGARPATQYQRKPRNLQPFDLNTADTTQLMQIRGIGRGLSARVVKYRQRLGGFRSPGQLAELYSLRDAPDLVDSLRKYTFVRAGFEPAGVDVNGASFEELQAHPYVGKRLARVLVSFRQQHGPFRQPTDLRQIRILDEATYEKLLPYLLIR